MYNCIRSCGWPPNTANCSGLYAIKLKSFYPWMFLVPDAWLLFKKHAMQRHINGSYLRFFAQITIGKLRPVPVGKTYRHLRPGGIASSAGIVGQQHDVFVTQLRHVFDSIIIEPYHSFTKWSSFPCFLMSFTTSRVLINTVAVLSHGWMPMSLFSKSLSM